MARNNKKITIQDVARAAGVSASTVSRVLNDKDDVAADTYKRVQEVIAELGYTSSLAARSMRSRRTGVIGLILPDLEDSFLIQVLKGINCAIAEFEYDLIAYASPSIGTPSKADREQLYVSLLNGSLTDGMIVVTPAAAGFPRIAPVVVIDPNRDCTECPAVIGSNYAGALMAMEYLLDLGHRCIGFISGRPDLQSADQRLRGYESALAQAGIPLDPDLIMEGDFTAETGHRVARELLSLPEPPTAIFAANDRSAIGAIEAAREMGLRVPEDLSVIGYDDIPEAAYYNPALTTIDQSILEMGRLATEILIRLIREENVKSGPYTVPTQLVVRGSCQEVKSE
ncbi:MAG: LacI family DNA-binding transcriptional regulator [Anaerolineae bacterium]